MNKMIKKQQLLDYIKIARPDHWIKHIFILPGIILAFLLIKEESTILPFSLFLGIPSAFLLSSANYVINEWNDRVFDQYHPIKKTRPAAAGRVTFKFVCLEYLILVCSGLFLAWNVCLTFFITSSVFLLAALAYNLKPLRFKDSAFLDVITESLNNPLRLLFGWSMVSHNTLAPNSLLIFYWFGGAFLMTTKRLAEYRHISKMNKLEDLKNYRRSFKHYSESSLLISSFLYSLLSAFFISAFLIKYRNEYLCVFPIFAILFAYYLRIALKDASIAQTPEKLYKDKGLLIIISCLVLSLLLFSFIDIPFVQKMVNSQILRLPL